MKELLLKEKLFALVIFEDGLVHRVNTYTRETESIFSKEDSNILIRLVKQVVL